MSSTSKKAMKSPLANLRALFLAWPSDKNISLLNYLIRESLYWATKSAVPSVEALSKKIIAHWFFAPPLMSSFHSRDLIIQVNVMVQKLSNEFSGKSSALHYEQHVFDRFPDFFIGAFITISFGIHPPVGALDGSLDDFFHIFFKIGFPLRGCLLYTSPSQRD